MMQLCEALSKFLETMPPVFAGTSLDRLTEGGYRWRTLQNEKSRGEVPISIFLKHGNRKTLIDRDRFLQHWQSKISRAA